MAHLNPHTAAIFSPSVARAAASTAKDWSFVDNWLARQFPGGRSPPVFERNNDTLRVLLALASANEAADEERQRIGRLEAGALRNLEQQDRNRRDNDKNDQAEASINATKLHDTRDAILAAVEDGLSREGRVALDTMATLAVEGGIAFATPTDLGQQMVEMAGKVGELEQTEGRVQVLARFLGAEALTIERLREELETSHYRPGTDLAKQNLEMQRKIKTMATRLPELRDKVTFLASSVGNMTNPTIKQVRQEEEAYLTLLARKKELDSQVKAFQGLPPDTDQARQELESLRSELRRMTQRRDAVFEGLVERETPRKPTR
ncbi:hypothetical protein B0T24DRAFT_212516 [Lasiosphaeria ovina]|uniref:HAUS augmin-like complex subunit 1 n=1 Tax=Lasiosphaeria ovina TaxID=92902 RepID=A0AAE0KGA0_9PEZI|nr:hypothetical protein B0T24DRAFT_212516 [Lasiosphaeria ovina]